MKIRSGFVSNSSSSSFIVINVGTDEKFIRELREKYITDNEFFADASFGESEFGWQNERYSDFWSKLNFAYIQAKYVEKDPKFLYPVTPHPEWLVMLENVLKDVFGVEKVVWNLELDYNTDGNNDCYGYIDHQSASYEGENVEMFESEDSLKRFLFSKGSYIQCGNDNEY